MPGIPSFEKATLEERQQFYYNAFLCIYCQVQTEFVSSLKVYQQDYGWIYFCPQCGSYVGCHQGTDKSYGTTANKELRILRNKAHQLFDPLCEAKMRAAGLKKKGAKSAGYKWLAGVLNIDVVECHIGFFNIEKCKIVIAECEKVYEAAKRTADMAKFKVDCVNWNAEEYEYEVKEFKMNNLWQLTLTQSKSGKSLDYKPKENIAKWAGKKSKWIPVEDIEQFIISNFK